MARFDKIMSNLATCKFFSHGHAGSLIVYFKMTLQKALLHSKIMSHKTWITEQNRIKPINSLNLGCEKLSFCWVRVECGSHPSAILTRPDPLSLRRKVFMVGYFSEDIPEDNNEDWTSVSLFYANKISLLDCRSMTSCWRHGTDILP